MEAHPSYSVVIPLWNKEREVRRAVASVLSQTVRSLELIVVDDGSTDAGPALVREIRDPRVRVLHQANRGVSAARNAGVAQARATIVAFLDADDAWLPDFLARIDRLVRTHPDAAVFATGAVAEEGGVRRRVTTAGVPAGFRGVVPDYFATSGVLNSSSVAVRRDALRAAGGFPEGVRFGEDLDLWLRLATRHRIAFDGEPAVVLHRDGANRASDAPAHSSYATLAATLCAIEQDPGISPQVKRAASAHVARIGLVELERFVARGQLQAARELGRSWRRRFTPGARYGLLMAATLLPSRALRAAHRAATWVARPPRLPGGHRGPPAALPQVPP